VFWWIPVLVALASGAALGLNSRGAPGVLVFLACCLAIAFSFYAVLIGCTPGDVLSGDAAGPLTSWAPAQ
jgi:hypothetical protein